MKRNQWRQRAASEQQNLTRLQCIESTRLKTDAHLQRALAHKTESRTCNLAASRFDLNRVDNERIMLDGVQIGAGGKQRVRDRRRVWHLEAQRR